MLGSQRLTNGPVDKGAIMDSGEQTEITAVLAQLRHAYTQLMHGAVKNQHAFGRSLIGPQIERLEKLLSK